MNQLEPYWFSNLRILFPDLPTVAVFIDSDKYLGKLSIRLTGLSKPAEHMDADTRLGICVSVLKQLALELYRS